jgi:hypothetical protein
MPEKTSYKAGGKKRQRDSWQSGILLPCDSEFRALSGSLDGTEKKGPVRLPRQERRVDWCAGQPEPEAPHLPGNADNVSFWQSTHSVRKK